MKKITLTVLLGMFVMGCAYSQMSFNGSKLTKSAFNLTASSDEQSIKDLPSSDMKITITDKEEEAMKKRRRHKGSSGDYSNSIKTNPLDLIFGYYGIMYERKIGDNMSLGLTVGLYSRSTDATTSFGGSTLGTTYSYSGFHISPEFRYYFESAIEGWYVSPYLKFTSFTDTETTTDGTNSSSIKNKYTVYGGGAGVGRQWIWGGFTLDSFIGIGYTNASITYDTNYQSSLSGGGLSFSGVLPAFGLAIGYSF